MTNSTFGITKTFNENDFIAEFTKANRADQFSYKGLTVMFESLNEMANDCQMNIEMDVIALCCEYTEASADDVIRDYGLDNDIDVEEYLQDNTMLLGAYELDGTEHFLYQAF